MYNLTLGSNDHFGQKNQLKKIMCFSCPMPLVKVNILLVNEDTLVKLELLKNHDFLEWCLSEQSSEYKMR
jgi:hypothetical protein